MHERLPYKCAACQSRNAVPRFKKLFFPQGTMLCPPSLHSCCCFSTPYYFSDLHRVAWRCAHKTFGVANCWLPAIWYLLDLLRQHPPEKLGNGRELRSQRGSSESNSGKCPTECSGVTGETTWIEGPRLRMDGRGDCVGVALSSDARG